MKKCAGILAVAILSLNSVLAMAGQASLPVNVDVITCDVDASKSSLAFPDLANPGHQVPVNSLVMDVIRRGDARLEYRGPNTFAGHTVDMQDDWGTQGTSAELAYEKGGKTAASSIQGGILKSVELVWAQADARIDFEAQSGVLNIAGGQAVQLKNCQASAYDYTPRTGIPMPKF